MITTVTVYDFTHNARLQRNFTYEALEALNDYFDDLEQSTGETLEFDPVAICCEFSEYPSVTDAILSYSDDIYSEDMTELKKLEWLTDNTDVIEFETGVILRDF